MKIYLIIDPIGRGYEIVKIFLGKEEAVEWAEVQHNAGYAILEIDVDEVPWSYYQAGE